MVSELRHFLGEDWVRTEALMTQYLSSDVSLLDKVNRSLLEGSGKKLRPMLCLLVAKAVRGQVSEDTCHFAAAMELLHNATLLHDDVVDGSEMRRGRPTLQSLMGGTASVLTGDYWLVKALECILDATGEERDEVLRMFSWTLSSLASGEILQLQMAMKGETREEEYLRIIRCKTACLFETAAVSGALSVLGKDSEEGERHCQRMQAISAVRAFALNLGLAFQIRDDILDYTGGAELGKPVGQDLMEQKITLPLLEAFATASPEEEAEIRRKVREIGEHPEYREDIVAFVDAHDGIARATARLDGFIQLAKQEISHFVRNDKSVIPSDNSTVIPSVSEESVTWLMTLADFTALRQQ